MKIEVHIQIKNTEQKYIGVDYHITLSKPENEIVLKFPAWSPGSYLIREFAANVEEVSVKDNRGQKLNLEKTDKSSWKIFPAGSVKITLSYRVYANDLSVRGIYADHDFVFVNMPALLFYPDGQTDLPVNLLLKLPPNWQLSFARDGRGGQYCFENFDAIYDTPLLAGKNLEFYRFRVKNTRFEIAVQGLYDSSFAKITPDLKKVLAAQIALFKGHPCSHYVFQIIFAPGLYGGLEHSASSTNMFDGLKLSGRREYQKFLSLLAHEHFHLWNVKRIRPKALGPFDYSRENYTRELWIAEGITSYYDDHTALRANVYAREDYLAILTENLHKFENSQARFNNSLSDSSFDAWIRFYRQNENSINRVTSYYLKGGLVMMLLDLDIIRRTSGKHTLDDVMRELFRLFRKRPESGITRDEFFAAAEKFSGHDYRRFIRDHIDGTAEINWADAFKDFGVKLKSNNKDSLYFAGLILKEKTGCVLIDKIAENSPAHASNLQPGDELISINSVRFFKAEHLNYFLKQKKWHVLFARQGKVHECHFELARNEKFNKTLVLKDRLSARERRFLGRFLRK